MYIETIWLNTNGIISSSLLPSFIQKSVVYSKLEFSYDQGGRGPKTPFSIAESAESSVAVFGDSIEYSGSGIVYRSITPIFSQNMPSFYWAKELAYFPILYYLSVCIDIIIPK